MSFCSIIVSGERGSEWCRASILWAIREWGGSAGGPQLSTTGKRCSDCTVQGTGIHYTATCFNSPFSQIFWILYEWYNGHLLLTFERYTDWSVICFRDVSEIISSLRFEASITSLCNISPSCEITSSWAACAPSRRRVWESWSGRWRARSRRKRTAGACWRMFSQTRPLLAVLSPRTAHWRTSWLSYRTVLSKWWVWWKTCGPSVC